MISLVLDQQVLKGGQRLPKASVCAIEKSINKLLKTKGSIEISVAFVSDAVMRKWNGVYRGKKETTDVLSFPFEGGEGEQGEILVSYKRALKQAKEAGHSTRSEVIFLIVHGVLHILGFTHGTKKNREKMFSLQHHILQQMGITIDL